MSFLKIAVTVLSLAFGSSREASFHQLSAGRVAPRIVSWRGSTGDLSLDLKFEQAGDSIYGRGTYRLGSKRRVGCGGETLSPEGYLTMRARGTRASFHGKFLFDSGWTPPVTGKQTATGSVRMSILSVDKGRCVLTLDRWEKD
jgi:hypothetical protein